MTEAKRAGLVSSSARPESRTGKSCFSLLPTSVAATIASYLLSSERFLGFARVCPACRVACQSALSWNSDWLRRSPMTSAQLAGLVGRSQGFRPPAVRIRATERNAVSQRLRLAEVFAALGRGLLRLSLHSDTARAEQVVSALSAATHPRLRELHVDCVSEPSNSYVSMGFRVDVAMARTLLELSELRVLRLLPEARGSVLSVQPDAVPLLCKLRLTELSLQEPKRGVPLVAAFAQAGMPLRTLVVVDAHAESLRAMETLPLTSLHCEHWPKDQQPALPSSLTELRLEEWTHRTVLSDLAVRVPRLRSLSVCCLESPTLDALLSLPRLRHLDLDAPASRESLRALAQLTQLTSLRLNYAYSNGWSCGPWMSPDLLGKALSGLRVSELTLQARSGGSSQPGRRAAIAAAARMPTLRHLRLEMPKLVDDELHSLLEHRCCAAPAVPVPADAKAESKADAETPLPPLLSLAVVGEHKLTAGCEEVGAACCCVLCDRRLLNRSSCVAAA